jgi:microcystin-dependent protein
MSVVIKNNATTTLAGAILSTDTTLSVASGTGSEFPALSDGDWFPLTVVDSSANLETMKCTAIDGDVLTVSRGQEGTTAAAFASGSRVDLRLTAAAIAEIQTNIANLQTLAATLAPLASPPLTGEPLAPTAANGTNTTQVATTAFVADALANGVPGTTPATYAGVPSGTVVFTLVKTAPSGWLLFDDGTVGDASSGASYADPDAEAIFDLLYSNTSDSNCPILASDGSATTRATQTDAATAWAAHCRMSLPKVLGRALAGTGTPSAGGVLGAWGIGQTFGEEEHTLTGGEMPIHNHGFTGTQQQWTSDQNDIDVGSGDASGPSGGRGKSTTQAITVTITPEGSIGDSGGGGAHNIISPTIHLNVIIKL